MAWPKTPNKVGLELSDGGMVKLVLELAFLTWSKVVVEV